MPNKRKIVQIHPIMLSIETFNSIIEAAIQTEIDRNSIIAACKGNQYHAGGYFWRYYDDYFKIINNNQYIRCYPNDNNLFNNKFICNPFYLTNNMYGYIQPCYTYRFGEIWLDILGYEGLYKVSNYGNILSIRNSPFIMEMKLQIDKNGYQIVELSKNGDVKYYKVHRLVAIAFIPNLENKPCINHKDENKLNNCVDNLEWCTVEYNNNYSTGYERRIKSRIRSYNG